MTVTKLGACVVAGLFLAGCAAAPTGGPTVHSTVHSMLAVATTPSVSCLLPPASCYTPAQFRTAYHSQTLLDRGITGRGRTVTVLAPLPPASLPAPGATDIRQDLATFDTVNHLPAAPVDIVTTLAGAGSPWRSTIEGAQDLEIVHAIAPAAALRVVLIPSDVLDNPANATADMLAGLRLAVTDTDVTSFSWSLGEHFFTPDQVTEMNTILAGAAARHVTVVASSGDQGAISDLFFGPSPVKEVSLPAADPLVLAVGGTTLTANRSTGAYLSETAWNSPPATKGGHSGGSGGGFSDHYARPAYQDHIAGSAPGRGVPDVAGDADPQTGMAIVVMDGGQHYIIGSASGTSASAPLWGGLMALADQDAGRDLGLVNPALYRIAGGPHYHQAFHDVVTGNNTAVVGSQTITGYSGAPGWDPVTGCGSPDAGVLIPLLAH